jgi:hypothetical protein
VGEAPVSSCHLFVSHRHTGIIHGFWSSTSTGSAVVRGKLGKVLLLFGFSPHARGINNRVTGWMVVGQRPHPTKPYSDGKCKDQEGCAMRDGPFVQLWVAEQVIALSGEG